MDKGKYIVLVLMMLMVLVLASFVSAKSTYTINEEFNITVICLNGGYCSIAAYCNINVINPDGETVISNENMTRDTSLFYYPYAPIVTGEYIVAGVCVDGEDSERIDFTFDVTNTGSQFTTGSSILYSLFSSILFGFLLILCFFVAVMPYDNERDDKGFETKIIRLKYVRVLLIFLMYPTTLLLLNFLNGMAINFSSLTMFSGILGFLFETLLRVSWPFTVIIIAWIVIMLVHDTNVWKQVDKLINLDKAAGL